MLVYRGLDLAREAAASERAFEANDWRGSWRNGIYPFHHFHSTAHEVLAIVSGRATVTLGGPQGEEVQANIAAVPLPGTDPVSGSDGALPGLWQSSAAADAV